MDIIKFGDKCLECNYPVCVQAAKHENYLMCSNCKKIYKNYEQYYTIEFSEEQQQFDFTDLSLEKDKILGQFGWVVVLESFTMRKFNLLMLFIDYDQKNPQKKLTLKYLQKRINDFNKSLTLYKNL